MQRTKTTNTYGIPTTCLLVSITMLSTITAHIVYIKQKNDVQLMQKSKHIFLCIIKSVSKTESTIPVAHFLSIFSSHYPVNLSYSMLVEVTLQWYNL